MDEDGIEIDRAILRALLKGLKKQKRLFLPRPCFFDQACLGKIADYWPNYFIARLYRLQRIRHGGLMVSALDSGASAPGSSPGRGHCVVFLGKTLYSHCASQVYKWVPANLILGGNPAMD